MPRPRLADRPLRVAMLGGLSEIGKNIAVIEYDEDIIIVDCGLGFPDEEMLGIDMVIPDFTYITENISRVRGLFLTHGHEDHIGSIPYLLKVADVPIYGTKLTLGILENKLAEHQLEFTPRLNVVTAGDIITAGVMTVEFIHVNHSIPDACALAISTPIGYVVHSGDFKVDYTPVSGDMIDLPRLSQIGKKGCLLLMCESTNVERPGITPSERTVGDTFGNIFQKYQSKRIVIATFSSNVHRVQQIINYSLAAGRRIAVTGRSMQNIIAAALQLGYITVPTDAIVDISEIKKYPPEKMTIITTGSQGEPMSALYRMAYGEHDRLTLGSGDLVVISANPIPGNEKMVDKIVNELLRRGVGIYRDNTSEVHVSGHACREEIKLFHALTKPKYVMPIHGEYKHLISHKELAVNMGLKPEDVFVGEIGQVLEIGRNSAKWGGTVPSGKIMVDGYGIGDVGNIVLRDRKHLAEDGLLVVVAAVNAVEGTLITGPDIISRGFVYVREADHLMSDIRQVAYEALSSCLKGGSIDWQSMKTRLKDDLIHFLYVRVKRRPMILPIIMDV